MATLNKGDNDYNNNNNNILLLLLLLLLFRILMNEDVLAHWGLMHQKKKTVVRNKHIAN